MVPLRNTFRNCLTGRNLDARFTAGKAFGNTGFRGWDDQVCPAERIGICPYAYKV